MRAQRLQNKAACPTWNAPLAPYIMQNTTMRSEQSLLFFVGLSERCSAHRTLKGSRMRKKKCGSTRCRGTLSQPPLCCSATNFVGGAHSKRNTPARFKELCVQDWIHLNRWMCSPQQQHLTVLHLATCLTMRRGIR